ncbi:BMP family ABC transporter substrate-binding protein [Nakamurella flavida]|uniref:BMP family ABC transporter substrate-binding protein n=1 Tax=Nakamurella flavida TaxID=363630 RepID=A0A938YRZ8_9ACTN|nr:BMP family ABC transporter substrate-binding protein [Nakamurella flavida]MBM9478384.1 BMP family ABC transporter substrate-binding protein [Nakamurella flavida]MDP9777755.1 basic membrane protein A [Nakamurella flavida]
MRRAHHLKLIAGLLATGLVVTACGSSGTAATSATSAASSAASSATSAMGSGMSSSSAATSGSATGSASGSATGSASSSAVESFPAITGDAASVKLGMAYDGPKGDQSFTDSAARGVEAATAEGVELVAELAATVGEPESAKTDRLSQLADQGANTIIAVGFDYATAMGQVAAAYPEVHFAIVDDSSLADVANVASLTFAAEQGSFLVGAAAALKSEAGHIGFIGGVNTPLIQSFEAGYDAGAKAVKADIQIDATYITEPPDFSGFNAPDKGETIANGQYSGGADIVYSAAGGSGTGVFKAAKAAGKLAIGVDSDQYNLPTLADVKDVILTSAVKNVDVAVYAMIASVADGSPLTGTQVYDLSNGGVGYATSGGFVDDIATQLEDYKAKIISGEITVPSTLS